MGKAQAGEDLELEISEARDITAASAGVVSTFADGTLICVPVSVGNPHAVTFVRDVEHFPLETVGPLVERHDVFPDGVNAEFVQVISPKELRMRVWERGSAVTMACGTGACASVAAAVRKGFCQPEEPVTIHLDGGDLKITMTRDGRMFMTGPAEFVYEGETMGN